MTIFRVKNIVFTLLLKVFSSFFPIIYNTNLPYKNLKIYLRVVFFYKTTLSTPTLNRDN